MIFRCGLAFCLSVAMASVAGAGAVIELVPDIPGPYDGGETLAVEVFLRQNPGDVDHLLRLVQLDLTDSDPAFGITFPEAHTGISFWDYSSTQHCFDNPTDCGPDHYIDGERFDGLPPGDDILVIAFGSAGELGADGDKQLTLLGDGSLLKIGEITVGVPVTAGTFMLDVVNEDETDPDLAAQVRWGFGAAVTAGDGQALTTWHGSTADLTGGTLEICVGPACIPDCVLMTSVPDCDSTLPRSQGNVIKLTFDCTNLTEPSPGDVIIQEITDGGGTGPDLSSNFMFSVEGASDVLRIKENGAILTNETWYTVRNAGGWTGVAPFKRDYQLLIGDANNDHRVLVNDLSLINSFVSIFVTPPDDSRANINDDNRVLPSDISLANTFVRLFPAPPAKPSGHLCDP